ncbi:MAG: hypothetical protein ACRC61_05385, partial [Aeromonas salmonicida]
RRFWKTPNLLEAPSKSQKKVKDSVISILNDNDGFAAQIEEVATHLEKMISESGVSTRERIRDYIRTESFVDDFTKKTFSKK